MKNLMLRLWKEEEGAETAEWLLIVGLLVAVGVAVYSVALSDGLEGLVTTITDAISTAIGGAGGG
ncbi:MAG: Flp family type IVb pilin [Chromatiaceae bacterium]|nr:Flp family type IVb pilin [Gammaproteobacteria bacterium]MCP5301378.1 Flp family type IVb pilin [Chromatiaceae bacterium]MCP5306643.1 Flp family type IVb pilin [Chromatiaceae bacterium]MCP5421856.1 Flp family type IVb pilin [Chromatiaceae bacterium]